MLVRLINETKNTKELRLQHDGEHVVVGLRLVTTRGEVQVDYLFHRGVKYTRWVDHVSFMELLGKCLGRRFDGTRKKFIEDLYFEKRN